MWERPVVSLTKIEGILLKAGSRSYGGEALSQLDHALQCAALAEERGETPALITACLLHDIGHLIEHNGEDFDGLKQTRDALHEVAGYEFLQPLFGTNITGPVLLHVAAKRYLCYADPVYRERLSPVSQKTLELQGGVYSTAEAQKFISRPYAQDAIRLRLYDDRAKNVEQVTPPLEHFLAIAATCVKPYALRENHANSNL
jgi:phosphonate degradation associated HDIG domain protein